MTDYIRIQQILDEAVNGTAFGGHGPFWRTLTRDQFVAKIVFGRKLIEKRPDGTFDPDESNLVKALEGRSPFGKDMVPRPSGSIWPRMPRDFPAVPADRIHEIRDWITAGCPDVAVAVDEWIDSDGGGPLADPTLHLTYFRDFDDWAMFNASAQTTDDINTFFGAAFTYIEFANNATLEPDWQAAVQQPSFVAAVQRLEVQQRETVTSHYGKPVPLQTLLDGFERFGNNTLPDDPLRPVDVRHNMNGQSMWFFWSAFIDSCLRLAPSTSIPHSFWHAMARAILIGLLNDGIFRGRFTVTGFTPDDAGRDLLRMHARDLPEEDLQAELMTRLRESEIFT